MASFFFQELQPASALLETDDSYLDNLIFNGQTSDTSSSSTSTTGRTQEPRPTSDHELRQGSVTGTPKPPTTELNDIFISVKTTKNYHDSRLSLIIKTWFQLAKSQVSTFYVLSSSSPEWLLWILSVIKWRRLLLLLRVDWIWLGFLLARGLPLKIFGDLELEMALFSSHRGAAIFAVLLRNHRIYW